MLSDINLNRYRLFCAVAECGSISKAAELNFISQPAISKAIGKIEESLGTALFIRNSRGVTLTDEGKILYEQINSAFEIIKAGEDKLMHISTLGIGRLRLGASSVLCKNMLLPFLKEYIEKYPNVNITVELMSSAKVYKSLKDGLIDIALMIKPESYSDIEFFSLGEIHDIFISAGTYLKNLERLQGDNNSNLFEQASIMLLGKDNLSRQHIDRYFREQGFTPVNVLEVSDMDMLIEFAKIGLGIACVVKEFVKKELKSGELVEIELDNPIKKREVGFAYLKNTGTTASMERFIETFKK